jgi:hypothetical protein
MPPSNPNIEISKALWYHKNTAYKKYPIDYLPAADEPIIAPVSPDYKA